MPIEHRYSGQGVGQGVAVGKPVFLREPANNHETLALEPSQARQRLEEALNRVRTYLRDRMARSDEDTAAILEFQAELLDDPALCEEVWPAIDTGVAADRAWQTAMAEQIEPFEADDDPYFRARAADLRDLRDRVLGELLERKEALAVAGLIVVAGDIGPARFLELCDDKPAGWLLEDGSSTSHVAILARARGLPMLVQTGAIAPCESLAIDASGHLAIGDPSPASLAAMESAALAQQALAARGAALLQDNALTANGERVWTYLNIDDPETIDGDMLKACDGIGLWRTEFLYLGRQAPPDEETQLEVMTAVAEQLGERPLVIRTLDIGGDKPLDYLSLDPEANPFLGLRGLRLCLAHPELWRPQLRAILRLAFDRPVKLMLPMVTRADELAAARTLIGEAADGLQRYRVPEIGIMVETPASAIACDLFDADFFSIGSNDLTQYVMAAARDAGGPIAKLIDPLDPAVMRLIERVIAHGAASGKQISLCGDMAADPTCAERLLAAGLRHFSVGSNALPTLRTVIADFDGTRT